MHVLSRSLADGPPGLDVPVDVQIRSVTDLTTRREADDVDIAVWGGQPSPSGKLLIPVCHVLFS